MRSKLTLFERFYPKIEFTETCWLWTGATLGRGYGVLGRGGAGAGNILAHRASYELFIGPIPNGLTIDHLCRVKLCVRPEHLEAVTNRENNLRAPTTLVAMHSAATHCPSGHPYDEQNTHRNRDGSRACKECIRRRGRIRDGKDPDSRRTLSAHCSNGHPWTPENTRVYRGARQCRTCHREWSAAAMRRKRAAAR